MQLRDSQCRLLLRTLYLLLPLGLAFFQVSFALPNLSRALSDGATSTFVVSGVFLIFPLNSSVFLLLHVAVGYLWRRGLLSEPETSVLLQVVACNDPSILEQSFLANVALVEFPDSGVLVRVQLGALVEEGQVAARNVSPELLPRARSVTAPDASEPALVIVVDVVVSDSLHLVVLHEALLFVLFPRVEADQIVILK